MLELLEKAFGLVGGFIIGALAVLLALASPETVILHGYACTKTGFVGETPHREERCVVYEKENHNGER